MARGRTTKFTHAGWQANLHTVLVPRWRMTSATKVAALLHQ
jgi:hypothetical protein